jgi:hypothetical protein
VKELERDIRRAMLGLVRWSGEAAMEPVYRLCKQDQYGEATAALMRMAAERTVVVHRWHEHVLLRAAVAYGIDPAPLRDAQTLPDWPVLEDFGFLIDHVIDWLEDRLPDGAAEHMRETHRCGEGGIVVGELVAYVQDGRIDVTRAEKQALQMLRYEADTDWFKYRIAVDPPPPQTNIARIARQESQGDARRSSYTASDGMDLADESIEQATDEAEAEYEVNCWNCTNRRRQPTDRVGGENV